MQGRRLPDTDLFEPDGMQPGDYWRDSDGVYWACAPSGELGCLVEHQVTEHADGTITVAPSILVTGARQWHGFLEHGIWREA